MSQPNNTHKTFSEIVISKVRDDFKNRVALNLRNIFDDLHKEEDYECFPNEDEDLVVELSDVTKTKFYFTIEVENTVDDTIAYEKRTITELHLTLDGSIFIYTEEDKDDEYDFTDLTTDDMFGISKMLDNIYYELCTK